MEDQSCQLISQKRAFYDEYQKFWSGYIERLEQNMQFYIDNEKVLLFEDNSGYWINCIQKARELLIQELYDYEQKFGRAHKSHKKHLPKDDRNPQGAQQHPGNPDKFDPFS